MVLVDAGAEHMGYASDISRTWPVSGRFSDAHREVYEAVLRVQLACIALCRGDKEMTMIRLHQESQLLMMNELAMLGVMKPNLVGTPDGCVAAQFLSSRPTVYTCYAPSIVSKPGWQGPVFVHSLLVLFSL